MELQNLELAKINFSNVYGGDIPPYKADLISGAIPASINDDLDESSWHVGGILCVQAVAGLHAIYAKDDFTVGLKQGPA